MFFIEKFRSQGHCNQDIRSEPVFFLGKGRVDCVFIDSSVSDHVSLDGVMNIVFLTFMRDVESLFKMSLDHFGPVFEGDGLTFEVDSVVREFFLLEEFRVAGKTMFEDSYHIDWSTSSWSSRDTFGSSFAGGSHFVHPGETVMLVTSDYKTSGGVSF